MKNFKRFAERATKDGKFTSIEVSNVFSIFNIFEKIIQQSLNLAFIDMKITHSSSLMCLMGLCRIRSHGTKNTSQDGKRR